ncbi:glycosyltransferase family 2 protein [Sediminibacterium soli]|uniref:glycosyltransferase family 2 protein n=1 Tax=Sediminibacterium soli TaxID=2698829 RepID=UPI00137B3B84|nr:glycosyltransferase family 2 protein [Sediminibacterium soli]NCI47726.1 glycosyltransferase family 2 protein [Sediminibacterium soli]
MNPLLSVVIICRNESHIIGRTIAAAQKVSDDIVVVDSGSTDGTQQVVTGTGARLLETGWTGYGPNKNKGVAMARHDWILSIDADEVLDQKLCDVLTVLALREDDIVYNIRFRAFLGEKMIRFGEWAGDEHIRLYNRNRVQWNEAEVHEALQMPDIKQVVTLKGYIHHYTSRNLEEFADKTVRYAMLNAMKYHQRGKKSWWLQRRLAGPVSFVTNYLLRLGFLDGEAGYTIAKMNAWYTWMKYAQLQQLNLGVKQK